MNEIDEILKRADETLMKMQTIDNPPPKKETVQIKVMNRNFSKLSLNQSKISPPRSKSTVRNNARPPGAYS